MFPSAAPNQGFPFNSPTPSEHLDDEESDSLSPMKETAFHIPSHSMQSSHQDLFGPNADFDIDRHHEDQAHFAANRGTLVKALDGSIGLVGDLKDYNEDQWTLRYPRQLGVTDTRSQTAATTGSLPSTPVKGRFNPSLRRSASLFTDGSSPSAEDATLTEAEGPTRPSAQRASSTTQAIASPSPATQSEPKHPLSILSLDLSLGTHSSVSSSSLLPGLSLQTLSHLLSKRLDTSLAHLSSLRTRVLDTSSRILVTGDLNAGKSTMVNALLRRDVMPADQQPCTTVFCEVLDAKSYNEGKEEIHAIRDVMKYHVGDPATYERYELEDVEKVQLMVGEECESGTAGGKEPYHLLKAYVTDRRCGSTEEEELQLANPSFIRNGLVSISLIDAPGLNRDTLSTTAIFARQTEIDVIVFVVSAENHFTLSAKEFLWNASREKAYVFVVVNKWDGIKDKKRCERVVGEQLKQLSPKTWEQRDELVHFVDAGKVIGREEKREEEDDAWLHLEQSLRSFVLLKRSRSKLAPAKTYILNLVADLIVLAEANIAVATKERNDAVEALDIVKPIHERLEKDKEAIESEIDGVEETTVKKVAAGTWKRLDAAVARIKNGQTATSDSDEEGIPAFPGIWALWSWASDIKVALVKSLELEIRAAEDDARAHTAAGVSFIMHDLTTKYLPGTALETEGRIFQPAVMFEKRRRGVGRLAMKGHSTGLGLGVVGLGAAGEGTWRATDFDISFLDLFDLEKIYALGGWGGNGKEDEVDSLETGAIVSLGIGGIGMVGSRLVGVKGAMDSVVRVWEVLGSKQAREWAAPVVAVLTVGLGVYLVYDLPNALPRNIGRKLDRALSPSLSTPSSGPPSTFASAHAERISHVSRKVIRLAGWDTRERFRSALDECARARKEVEVSMGRAVGALGWLSQFVEKASIEQKRVSEVTL